MEENPKYMTDIREGLTSGLPVVIGYFPVAMAFGLLSKTVNVSFLDSCLFSLLVFAGASQFMALDLIKAGIATGNIILATFLLNLRHMMMSASLSVRLKETKKSMLLFIAFGITDETFSVSSIKGGRLSTSFLLTLHTVSYSAWVLGTAVGYLVGAVLPIAIQNSLGIGLYAMFTALLIPETKKSGNVMLLSLISATIYIIVSSFGLVPSGWTIVTTIILASLMGLLVLKDDNREEQV